MQYAAELIDRAKKTQGWKFDTELAAAMGVDKTNLSAWKHGRGSPMPQERVIELCDLAGIPEKDRGYWLTGVERDAVTITSVRRALDVVLDRLRPTVAAVGLIVLGGPLIAPAKTLSTDRIPQSEPTSAMYIMRTRVRRWFKKLDRAFTNTPPWFRYGHGPSTVLA